MEAQQERERGPRPRVLVADDEPQTRAIVTAILEGLGCRVDAVGNGAEAVEAAGRERYDLIFMDGVMPVLDGLEATRRIRRAEGNGRRVPVVGITGNTRQFTERACREAGMDGYLRKPVGRKDYAQAVARWAPSPEGRPPSADARA